MCNAGDKTQKNTKEDKNNILCIKNEAFSESFQDPRDDKQQDDQEEPVNKLKVGNQNDTSYKEMDNIKIHINGEEVWLLIHIIFEYRTSLKVTHE